MRALRLQRLSWGGDGAIRFWSLDGAPLVDGGLNPRLSGGGENGL